uniref:Uncharacterized protein n=1 Tax=Arundo donax TaxID=35708 RepID=A0A0A9E595_ARUDO
MRHPSRSANASIRSFCSCVNLVRNRFLPEPDPEPRDMPTLGATIMGPIIPDMSSPSSRPEWEVEGSASGRCCMCPAAASCCWWW